MVLKLLIILQNSLKLKSSLVARQYICLFIQCYMTRIGMIERPQIIFPEPLFLSYSKNIEHIVIPSINNSRAQILSSQARKRCSICWQIVTNRCKKYAGCTITPVATKTRRYIYIGSHQSL